MDGPSAGFDIDSVVQVSVAELETFESLIVSDRDFSAHKQTISEIAAGLRRSGSNGAQERATLEQLMDTYNQMYGQSHSREVADESDAVQQQQQPDNEQRNVIVSKPTTKDEVESEASNADLADPCIGTSKEGNRGRDHAHNGSRQKQPAVASSTVFLAEVSEQEFASVPRYLKGTCKLPALNGFVRALNRALHTKYSLLNLDRRKQNYKIREQIRRYEQQGTTECDGHRFCTDADLKKECDAATYGRARIFVPILRQLQKIRDLHVRNEMRYIIIEPARF